VRWCDEAVMAPPRPQAVGGVRGGGAEVGDAREEAHRADEEGCHVFPAPHGRAIVGPFSKLSETT
jgi:hypothetical protein